jgi:tRNA modification GTPase
VHLITPSTDTITAIATPPGRGGITIIRVSGPHVQHIATAILNTQLKPRIATYLPFYDTTGDTLDEGVAIFFPNPHSFTGEDVLELHGHGGPVVVDLLLQRILTVGARLARPGEFSERAFLNGKMDLAQTEAIADLINASSKQAARSALRSLQGDFSKAINAINEKVIHLRIYVEAAIDFTDEEIDFLGDEKITSALTTIRQDLATIQSQAKQGSFLREGITVVIIGEPNVGKSSLLNCLSGKEVAIVTNIPGTTRDVLRDHILIDGMPMHIIDTAGLRDSNDVVEQEGIRRAYREMEAADLILYVMDATKNASDLPLELTGRSVIVIRNKIDLVPATAEIHMQNDYPVVNVSATSSIGLDLLKDQIKMQIGYKGNTEGAFLARRRHLDALARAETHINAAVSQLTNGRHGELAAEDLRQAHLALCEITGEFTTDDLLGHIFASFCIGK